MHNRSAFVLRKGPSAVQIVECAVGVPFTEARSCDVARVTSCSSQNIDTCAMTGEAAGLGRDWSKAANRVPLDHEGPITAVEQVRNSWGEASQWSAKLSHGRWRRRRR